MDIPSGRQLLYHQVYQQKPDHLLHNPDILTADTSQEKT